MRAEIREDVRVVKRSADEGLTGEARARGERECTVIGAHLVEHSAVRVGRDDDRHVSVVLRRGANHRRAADVYLLDGLFERDALAGDRLLEGVEVDDDHVNRLDAVLFERPRVFGTLADGEDAAVYARVERLDAAVQ